MKNKLKKILYPVTFRFLKLFYPEAKLDNFSPLILLRFVYFQKIFSVNRRVPWPVHNSSIVLAPEKIENNGSSPGFSIANYIDGRNGICLGKNIFIGPRVSIISQDHNNLDYNDYVVDKKIIIGENCLLTSGCIILPGVELGNHTIVAAGAVVTKSFPEGNQIIGGNPARVLKTLGDYKCVE
ncbi:MAG: acyltransferase [Candidatus Delongbacteria bacterium]|nr:acyltransferase [Candidatus Delongbacteria bacterium]MBN2836936.1 acyltransferase [Candidatus Delongbacteria bacterium]